MKYRNLVTGAVIDIESTIKGKNWELIGGKVETPAPVVSAPVVEETPEVVEEVKPVKKTRKTTKTSKK